MPGLAQVDAVVIHIPHFIRNSPAGVADDAIQTWIDTRWEEINAVLVRRALAVPAEGTDGWTKLELINRLGAAADLAAALSATFSPGTRWQVEKNLRDDYLRLLAGLDRGDLDKLLDPAAQTADVGPAMQAIGGADAPRHFDRDANVFFQKDMRF